MAGKVHRTPALTQGVQLRTLAGFVPVVAVAPQRRQDQKAQEGAASPGIDVDTLDSA